MAVVMLLSLMAVPAFAADRSVVIREKSFGLASTSATVDVTGYGSYAGDATVVLTVGESGTENDYGMGGRTVLGRKSYTGDGEYTFDFSSDKLMAGGNLQAYMFYYNGSIDDYSYGYGTAVEITGDESDEPEAEIRTESITDKTTELAVYIKNLPESGIFRIVELDNGESFSSDKLNGYTSLYFSLVTALANGENKIELTSAPSAGSKIVAVIRSTVGEMTDYVSDPVQVEAASKPETKPSEPAVRSYDVQIKGILDETSTNLSFFIAAKSGGSDNINIAALYRVDENGNVTGEPIARSFGVKAGSVITFDGIAGLTPGEKLKVVLTYNNGESTYTSDAYTVCDSAEEDVFEIVEESFTASSTTVTVRISGFNFYRNRGDSCRIWITTGSADQTTAGDDEGREDLAMKQYTGAGEYTFTIDPSELREGNSIMAALRFYDADGVEGREDWEWYDENAVDTKLIKNADKTYSEIMAGCTVRIVDENGAIRTDGVRQGKATLKFNVKLDEAIAGCHMFVIAYPANASFDEDSIGNRSLGGADVTDGWNGTVEVDTSAIPVGYKVAAYLWVPLNAEDMYYLASPSQSIEVLDENGEGFDEYVLPDAKIDETSLSTSDKTVHVTLTGDERIFAAAAEKKINVSVVVAQYPEGESFDFEGENQIRLGAYHGVTEAFSGRELQLEAPLRAGYRVRAVVYWSQNVELMLPKGNDYEESFHCPDDSVAVAAPTAVSLPESIDEGAESVVIELSGTIDEGAVLVVKKYAADETSIALSTGTFAASSSQPKQGENTLTFSALLPGEKLCAYLVKDGEVLAQSEVLTAASVPDMTIAFSGAVNTETESIRFTVTPKAGLEEANINIAALCRVDENGKTDVTSSDSYIVRKFMQKPGEIELSGISGLERGERLRIVIRYTGADGDILTLESENITVLAPAAADSLVIQENEFGLDSTSATVTVNGCEDYLGCTIYLKTGTPSTDNYDEGRVLLATAKYTAPGTYTFTFDSSKLKNGNTVQAYLYKYDADADIIHTKYSNSVMINGEPEKTEAKVEIVTANVTEASKTVYVSAEFDGSALVGLYTYSGDEFTLTDRDSYVALKYFASAPSASQSVAIGEGKLKAGDKLVAVLFTGGISGEIAAQSAPVTIGKAPEKAKPEAYITNTEPTAGITRLNVSMSFDAAVSERSYVLYQFAGETLDTETAEVLSSGTPSNGQRSIYVGIGRLKAGQKLQLALTADGETAYSNVVSVLPSPDWGTPYAAFNVSAVKSDAESIDVVIDYSDDYLTLGDEFYCDVTVYSFPSSYTDDEFENSELWENFTVAHSVAKVNSRNGQQTRGEISLLVYESAVLTPGDRLIIKLRLPHVEWEGEEVDYVSASVPVVAADEDVASPMVLLYNLGEDKSLGRRLREVLSGLGISAADVTADMLGETVGYLTNRPGYVESGEAYTGDVSDEEFMLMANMPEALLDRFLDEMKENGIFIGNKAVTTDYNIEYEFHELIDDIANEHNTFQLLLELDSLTKKAESLDEKTYGSAERWGELQTAIEAANDTLRSYEPTADELEAAIAGLKGPYLAVSGMSEISGEAVIAAEKQENGLYRLKASVLPGGEEYAYGWNSGESGAVIENVAAEDVITKIVTVSGEKLLGTLTAQLTVPEKPDAKASVKSGSIKLTSELSGEKSNRPAAETIVYELYDNDGSRIDVKKGADAEFSGLAAGKYVVKATAVSFVGESDTQTIEVSVPKAVKPSQSGGGSSSSASGQTKPSVEPEKKDVDFDDVSKGDYFYDAVLWAVENGITSGMTKVSFAPDVKCTRAMMVLLMYRAAGSPDVSGIENPFEDVAENAYYRDAVLWAYKNGITSGVTETSFAPDDTLARAQAVTLLHRSKGAPQAGESGFLDVDDGSYYAAAVAWAAENGITLGVSETEFGPAAAVTRAQIVTFLYRAK